MRDAATGRASPRPARQAPTDQLVQGVDDVARHPVAPVHPTPGHAAVHPAQSSRGTGPTRSASSDTVRCRGVHEGASPSRVSASSSRRCGVTRPVGKSCAASSSAHCALPHQHRELRPWLPSRGWRPRCRPAGAHSIRNRHASARKRLPARATESALLLLTRIPFAHESRSGSLDDQCALGTGLSGYPIVEDWIGEGLDSIE